MLLGLLGSLFQIPSCDRLVSQEIEVLLHPEASATLIGQNSLVKFFGPQILNFF